MMEPWERKLWAGNILDTLEWALVQYLGEEHSKRVANAARAELERIKRAELGKDGP